MRRKRSVISPKLKPCAMNCTESGIGTLVCGAISTPLSELMVAYGIRVIPFVAGDVGEVIAAWCNGDLDSRHFDMPGCTERHRNSAEALAT